MQKLTPLFQFLLLVTLVSSCGHQKAPIIDRGSVVYDSSFSKNKKYQKTSREKYNSSYQKSGVVVVQKGDTIYAIARRYNVSLRDVINKNNLTPPYIVKIGDKISLPSGQHYQVVRGDTLYSISRKFDMNVNNLIAINDLSRPYSIRVGQKLKVGSSVASNKQNSVAYQKSLKSNSSSVKSKPIPELKIANKNNRFSWPVKGAVISKFGPKDGGLYNDGINIKAQNGDSVKSAEDGVVAYVGNELRGYGNLIIVKHAGGWISAYGHLDETKVKRGVNVKKGQTIAQVGSTGNVKSPQLYFGLRKGRDAVNPQKYL